MSFKVIKGSFHVVGYSPDGDSIRFKAEDTSSWEQLGGGKVKLNSKGHAQLRIEGIDTLETHYEQEHQPKEFAVLATNYLFKLLGVENVIWNDSGSKVTSANDGVTGYIVSRQAERYGRPVSFVFPNLSELKSVDELYLNSQIARKSVNYKMLSKGLAYPTFYDGMFYDLRELFSKAAVKARSSKKGLWSEDKTNTYCAINSLIDVTENNIILPKLFRRVTAYLKDHDSFDSKKFIAELGKKPEEVLMLNILHFTHFDNLLSVNSQGKIKLTQKPENLVFLG